MPCGTLERRNLRPRRQVVRGAPAVRSDVPQADVVLAVEAQVIERYLAAPNPEFRHPQDDPPPLGTKLLILTRGGVTVTGLWDPEQGSIAWAPMPKVSPELKAQLRADGHNV